MRNVGLLKHINQRDSGDTEPHTCDKAWIMANLKLVYLWFLQIMFRILDFFLSYLFPNHQKFSALPTLSIRFIFTILLFTSTKHKFLHQVRFLFYPPFCVLQGECSSTLFISYLILEWCATLIENSYDVIVNDSEWKLKLSSTIIIMTIWTGLNSLNQKSTMMFELCLAGVGNLNCKCQVFPAEYKCYVFKDGGV